MGRIIEILGPIIKVSNIKNPKIHDIVLVGEEKLYGEILKIEKNTSIIQVFEPTIGLSIGDKVISTQRPLMIELGPGIINNIFDGLQRKFTQEAFLKHRYVVNKLDRKKKWHFKPYFKKKKVSGGELIGEVKEEGFVHKIMMPPNISGEANIKEGDYTLDEPIGKIGKNNLYLYHEWPVKIPRPVKKTLLPIKPLITGQRVIDTLFPLAQGGAAALPGPFGSGKTVLQQGFAKMAKADIKIFVGCGERGNETADLLEQMRREKINGIFFINTSNMPIIARESSIYTGVTVAEYFRDMGYDALLMVDSLSRWAEALREISSIMNELPAKSGFPAYLPSRINQFFERAGRVVSLGEKEGTLTIIGSVSPPSGDFSEPVTQYATSITNVAWFLDKNLAYKRHYPAVSWELSYSNYQELILSWWKKIDSNWDKNVLLLKQLLEEESELEALVKAIGFVSLSRLQKIKYTVMKIIHEGFLKQNAFHPYDKYCDPKKQARILNIIISFYNACVKSSRSADDLANDKIIMEIISLKNLPNKEFNIKEKEIKEYIKKL